jgi:hypothetical protein
MAIQKNIKVKNPCEVEWESLNGMGDVRMCQFCSKNVVDFTDKTEKEIIDYVLGQKDFVCGRLTKPNSINKSFLNIRRPLIRASILLALGINFPKASTAVEKQMFTNSVFSVSVKRLVKSPLKLESSDSTISIRGKVIDISDSLPIQGVRIELIDSEFSTLTNLDGGFVMDIPFNKLNKPNSKVRIRYLGYRTVELELNNFKEESIQIALEPMEMVLGEVVIAGTKRKWWAIKSIFRRKKKRDN